MKVGILTFHNAHNYGAVLQAYALRTVIRKMGHDAFILNYRNKGIEKQYPENLDTADIKKQDEWHRQYMRFENFINQILLEDNTRYLQIEDLKDMDIDCFICGSDQIWETGLTDGIDPVYFLDFECKAKKMSYAASKAFASISAESRLYFRRTLSEFQAVSVREGSVADELNTIGIPAVNVLDPTLLLKAGDYEALLSYGKEGNEKYVLAYYIVEDEELEQCVRQASDQLGLRAKEIHFYRVPNAVDGQMADCGPEEFIELFKNAAYVFTNSFHGVIFSIIFHKSFYAVYKRDNRKDEFLKKIGLESRHITNRTELILNDVVYADADERLNKEKERSLKFLEQNLNSFRQ